VQRASARRLPICYIDGQIVGGTLQLRALQESGELRTRFGGRELRKVPPCPEELLEWRCGEWKEPEDWEEMRSHMRIERDPITAELRWKVATPVANGVLQASEARVSQEKDKSRRREDKAARKDEKAAKKEKKASDIESLVDFRLFKGSEQWRVRWRGCGPDEDTWERWDKLDSPALQERAKTLRMQT